MRKCPWKSLAGLGALCQFHCCSDYCCLSHLHLNLRTLPQRQLRIFYPTGSWTVSFPCPAPTSRRTTWPLGSPARRSCLTCAALGRVWEKALCLRILLLVGWGGRWCPPAAPVENGDSGIQGRAPPLVLSQNDLDADGQFIFSWSDRLVICSFLSAYRGSPGIPECQQLRQVLRSEVSKAGPACPSEACRPGQAPVNRWWQSPRPMCTRFSARMS